MPGLNPNGGRRATPDTPALEPIWADNLGEHAIALAWSPDGRSLAAAPVCGPILVLDGATGVRLQEFPGHGFGTTALAWGPDSLILASAGQDGKVRAWDTRAGTERFRVDGGAAWVEKLAWCSTEPILATGAGRVLRLWSPEGDLLRQYPTQPSTIADLSWRPGRAELASAAYGQLVIWSPEADEPVRLFSWKGSMLALAWSPNGRSIATGNQDATVHFWDVPTGEDLQMWGYPTKVRELAWDSVGRWLATGGGPEACVWDCSGKGPAGTHPLQLRLTGASVRALGFRPGPDPLLAVGFADGTVGLWRLGKVASRIDLFRLDAGISQLAWQPQQGRILALATEEGGLAGFADNRPSPGAKHATSRG